MSSKNVLGEDRVPRKRTEMNKKFKYKCYLAHPYESRDDDEIKEIIDELKSRGVTVVNPFDGEDKLMLEKYGRTNYYPDPPYDLGREIWMKDERQVKECNMILVYVPNGQRLSGGCGIEMRKAYDKFRDTHLELNGKVVNSLTALYFRDWYYSSNEFIDDEKYYKAVAVESKGLVQIIPSGPDFNYPPIRNTYVRMINNAINGAIFQVERIEVFTSS